MKINAEKARRLSRVARERKGDAFDRVRKTSMLPEERRRSGEGEQPEEKHASAKTMSLLDLRLRKGD